ncbi:MAG: hypothetical protein RBS72_13375 [Sedimentisphaerales bacterium]|jgi:hypothetical protein|nr:hypothetical protein [Sedimentisphaerales bacterium]HNY76793.1 hypothetical protein [Sedimentisphaerales bacterium]HOC61600.1 hypothetical protein [Sedimentisphaerales bacterium]HOH62432.1 hypothetical protein [Sedimentisphaerales bacterium]HQA91834.1 hypothetical protein [Sedimentisphaerales bacterium]
MIARLAAALMIVICATTGQGLASRSEPLIIDHTCTEIASIPESAIVQAKQQLHIAYGHTSHGWQITTGMTGLVAFANAGGKGLKLPKDIFAWNDGGIDGALDLHDYAMPGDLGEYPGWVDRTRVYLNDPQNAEVNVIMWSWCSQVSSRYVNDRLMTEYLNPMSQLEEDYPHVTFIYMTGHVHHSQDMYLKAANYVVREYCKANNKVLYDFADIESYDPDGTFYPFADENCDYYASRTGSLLGNWAKEWQDSHTINVDWYDCPSPHSEPLNANQKAYAAWWLFARLGGWPGPCSSNGADLDCDGVVNLVDLALFSDRWLARQ